MKNFTKEHLNAVVNYADIVFDTITPELKAAAEKVAEYLGEPQEFFTEKSISSDAPVDQRVLECVLRFTALDDERAFEKLCEINKKNANNIRCSSTSNQMFYEHDEYFSYLFRCVSSLRWVKAIAKQDILTKKASIGKILETQIKLQIAEDQRILEAGSESQKHAEDFRKLLKRFEGDVFRIIDMSFEEYKELFPRRGRFAYDNIIALANKRRESSYDALLDDKDLDKSKCQFFVDNRTLGNSLQEGIRDTFQNAVNYTNTIVEKAEAMGDRVYTDKFRSVNLGYQLLIDRSINDMTEEEVTAYYSKCADFSKLWAAHSYNYFIKKAVEDFKEHWKFYTDGDEEVQSYVQYLIKAMAAA